MNMRKLIVAEAIAASAAIPMVANAATVYWQKSATGGYNWNDSSNWNTALDGSGEAVIPGEGDTLDFSNCTAGTWYYFTNNIPGDVWFKDCTKLCSTNGGSTPKTANISLDSGTFSFTDQSNTYEFTRVHVGDDARLRFGNLSMKYAVSGTSGNNYFIYEIKGEVEIMDSLVDSVSSSDSSTYIVRGTVTAPMKGIMRVQKFVHSGSTQSSHRFCLNQTSSLSGTNTFVVGAGGFTFSGNRDKNTQCSPFYSVRDAHVAIAASSDFTIHANPYDTRAFLLERSASSKPFGSLIFDTADYDDRKKGILTPRTVTVDGGISGSGNVIVRGCGALEIASSGTVFTGGLTVGETASVVVHAGCKPGNGAVALNDTATLKVAQSGTVTLGGTLTAAAGTTLAYNFTDAAMTPTLSATSVTLPADGMVNVKVTSDDGFAKGTYTLISGADFTNGDLAKFAMNPELSNDWCGALSIVDGNLVLAVNPKPGLMIIVK